ncbi:MAG TPA: M1 family metallopeptidase [Candidatus Angelobacter sp.]|nr:M1 family metallopeptidase [Candidatus Angelobacter sp.]
MHHLLDATMVDMQTVARLIENFIPSSYDISLSINRVDRVFEGIVTIHGRSISGTNNIILHSKDLDIISVAIDGKEAVFESGVSDALIINHPSIENGNHILVIAYSGKITDTMHGMYPCHYEHDGVQKELLATQFESHHAREVFPCIDEPAAKATFKVTLTTKPGVTVLGNMPIKNQKTENNKLVTTFDTTPIMSSYLLAWVIGELHKKTAYTKTGVEINVWSTVAQPLESLDFGLDIATRSIDFFDDYFGIAYPLPKCDHVALPDFSSGAMENWGLITYREMLLLADPKTTSVSCKHYIAAVITHEVSHQWFGNLVTMEWWNDLWLNESFATFIEYVALDALEPSWNVWLDFASSESMYALSRDSLAGVQPIQIDINHPDEISTLFDGAIVYAKGAKLLKMLQAYIGDSAFKTGLKNYFQIYAYKNTKASDLWSSFATSSQTDIVTLMNCWITQPGFPVLHVSSSNNLITLSQERLVSKSSIKSDALWQIPLTSNCPEMPQLLSGKTLEIGISPCSPLCFNIGNNAHFITHYDKGLFKQLISQLKSGKLDAIDRLQLLNEQTMLADAGIVSNADLIPLVDNYRNESIEAVWDIISVTIGELKKFVEDDINAELKLRSFVGSLAQIQFNRLGFDAKSNESETDTKLRRTIIGLMLYSEDKSVIEWANNIYSSTSLDIINPELRSLVLSSVVRHAENDELIDSLIVAHKSAKSSEIQNDICAGLTSSKQPKTVSKLLNLAKDTTFIRTQDTSRWLARLSHNKYSRQQTWQWVRENWGWIKATFATDQNYDDHPRYIASSLSTRKQLDEYREFFTPLRSVLVLTRVIDMGINEITDRVKIIERDGSTVKQTLLNL